MTRKKANVKIIDFQPEHKQACIDISKHHIPENTPGLESIEDTFGAIAKYTQKELTPEEVDYFKNEEKIDVDRGLHYKVAVDNDGKVLGVSGIYGTKSGYLDKFEALEGKISPELRTKMENQNNLWLGWTGVAAGHERQGIGTELLKSLLPQAAKMLNEQGVNDAQLCIIAEKKAEKFYESLGLHKEVVNNHDFDVLSISLKELARNLGSKAFDNLPPHIVEGGHAIDIAKQDPKRDINE